MEQDHIPPILSASSVSICKAGWEDSWARVFQGLFWVDSSVFFLLEDTIIFVYSFLELSGLWVLKVSFIPSTFFTSSSLLSGCQLTSKGYLDRTLSNLRNCIWCNENDFCGTFGEKD